jgi:uncharacterized protein (TIGR00251 family)
VSPEPDGWVSSAADGSIVRIHARPGASHPGIAGFHGDALSVRVRARAVDGAANRELLATLAAALDVPPRSLEIASGAQGREKRILVHGLDAAAIRARLFVDKAQPRD